MRLRYGTLVFKLFGHVVIDYFRRGRCLYCIAHVVGQQRADSDHCLRWLAFLL